ncbi:MAG TPA: phosphodiester glycosidase family protein, partial [Anaerolineales bacterium]
RLSDGLTGWSSTQFLEKITTTPPPPPPTGDKYRVTATSRLHIRSGPGTQFTSLGLLEFNEVVTAIAVNPDGTWRQVRRSDGLTGWSSAQFLTLVPNTPPPPPPPPGDVAGNWYRVTTQLNAREGPGTSFNIIGALNKDEVVEALDANADQTWIRISRVDGWSAWASAGFLTKVGKNPASITQNIFKGVTYYRNERTTPRALIWHVIEIDTRATEGLRFLVTPPLRDTVPQVCTRTTSQFLDDHDMQIAINGDGYFYLDPTDYPPQNYCATSDPVKLMGYAASRGKVYSPKAPEHPILYINQRNEITFNAPKGKIFNAISGDRMLISRGNKVAGLDAQIVNPRTAIGINQNARYLYLMVIDGRETSIGATFSQTADLLLAHGVYHAMALDGGGSSTMVIEGVNRLPHLLNTPVNQETPKKERAVANHLGISLKK